MKIHFLLFFAMCLGLTALAGDASPPKMPARYFRTWKISLGFIPRTEGPNPVPSIRSWLEAQGVKFSPEDEVLFNPPEDMVVLAAKKETLQQIDAAFPIVGAITEDLPNLLIEVDLVELPAGKAPALGGEIPSDVLARAAGHSWHFLNSIVIATVSGQRVSAVSRAGVPGTKVSTIASGQTFPPDDPAALPPGVTGASADVEPVMDEDGKNIHLNLSYHYRGAGKQVWDTRSLLSLAVADGLPTVAQLESPPGETTRGKPAKLRALLVTVQVLHPHKAAAHGAPPRRK